MRKFFLCFLLVILVSACSNNSSNDKTQENPISTGKLKVLATTNIVGDLLKHLGTGAIEVDVLMGPGVDPHLYKASAGDINRMYSANAIFYNGLHLEGKMAEVLEKFSKKVKTVAVTDGIDRSKLLKPAEFEGSFDPHLWFDVMLWAEVAKYVKKALVEIDPKNKDIYNKNAEVYLEKLNDLNKYVTGKVSAVAPDKRVLITAHDAFNYFGSAYGFKVKGLQGISTTLEAGAADMQELANFIVERKIPAIFVETSVPTRFIEALKEAVKSRGFDVKIGGSLYSDALGAPGEEAATYTGMVTHNVDTIVGALLDNGK